MQLTDMIKLLYQSEFAGSHEASRKLASVLKLEEECLTVPCSAGAVENIGNGLCRLHLCNIKQIGIGMDTVSRLFAATANTVQASADGFIKKLELLHQCIKEGLLPFDSQQFLEFTEEMRKNGWPPVRHSREYHEAYNPAYRIIKKEYCKYIEAFSAIDKLLAQKASITVAIEGRSGAGKSTLAALFCQVYDSISLFHMDDFFLPHSRKTKERLAEPGGNIDYERFGDEVLYGLKSAAPFNYRKYDCALDKLSPPVSACPSHLNVIEGVYSMHPNLRESYDYAVFLDADTQTQSERIKKRSGESLHKRFLEEWIPLEELYFSAYNIKSLCDTVY